MGSFTAMRQRKKRWTAGLVVAGLLGGGLVSVAQVTAPPQVAQSLGAGTKSAAAATPIGTQWQLATNSLSLAAYSISGVPGLFYCASATAPAPVSDNQTDLGELDLSRLRANSPVAMRSDLTPDMIAGVNRIQHVYGQDAKKPIQVAAVSGATHWALQGGEISSREFGGNTDLRAAVRWAVARDPELKDTNVADLAVQYYNEALSYTAPPPVSAGTVTVTGAINATDNYNATITVSPTVAGGAVAFDLVNATFAGGGTHFAGTLNGATSFAVRGTPPHGAAHYKIGVTSGHYTVTGTAGYAATLHAYSTPGAQTIVVGGAQTTGSASTTFAWASATESSAVFQPAFASKLGKGVYQPGDEPVDHFTVSLAAMAGGLVNEWPRSGSGAYAALPVIATMYLVKAPLTPAASVPPGAKAIATGTATVGGGATDPTTDGGFDITLSKLSGSQVDLSGHVTVVLTIDRAKLAADVAALLPPGWADAYATQFGDPAESAVVPPEVSSRASTTTGLTASVNGAQVPATGQGLPIYDSYTVTGYVDASEKLSLVPRHYTAKTTIDSEGMLQDGELTCTADTRDATGEPIAITHPGEYSKAWKVTPEVNGLGTFTAQFVDAGGAPAGPESDCRDTREWTAQQQLLIHTVAAQNAAGKVRDTATVFGTVKPGEQLVANLHNQRGAQASVNDEVACTTEPVGIPQGLANALTVSTPWTDCPAFSGKRYFREIALDVEGNVDEHGLPGVLSEYLPDTHGAPEAPSAAPTAGDVTAPAAPAAVRAKTLPVISG